MCIWIFNFKKKDVDKYPEGKEEVGIDILYAAAMSCGLDSKMLEDMTAGNLVDYILTYNSLHGLDKEENTIREATQDDFDNF